MTELYPLDDDQLDYWDRVHYSRTVQVGSHTHGGGPQYVEQCGRCMEIWPCSLVKTVAELRVTRTRLDAVEKLHQRYVLHGWRRVAACIPEQVGWDREGYCPSCRVLWPCRTAAAVEVADTKETNE